MSEKDLSRDAKPAVPRRGKHNLKEMPFWRKATLAGSVVLMILGGVLWVAGALGGDSGTQENAVNGADGELTPEERKALPRGFAPDGSPLPDLFPGETKSGNATEEGDGSWTPALFKLGFGFFAGFCMGYALRAFFKMSLVGIGLILLMMFGLQYAGVIDVDWTQVESIFGKAGAWLKTQTTSFRTFVTGQIPSAGTAMFGAFVGFKKI